MYFQGLGLPKDSVEALAWFQVAMHQGHEGAAGHFKRLQPLLAPEAIVAAGQRFRVISAGLDARP